MTYSLVAHDAATGQLGVAVQSHFFGAGRIVGWARTGVGAVASQALGVPLYGPRGLALLRDGTAPDEVLATLLADDAGRETRQLAVLAADGRGAVHTGSACVPSAGHLVAEGVTAQGNMLADDGVLPALLAGFQGAAGDLAARLLAGLDAAEAAGGDIRGRQSAALLVVPGGAPSAEPWEEPLVDVRVDDHPEPLRELRRLAELNRFYLRLIELLEETGLFAGSLTDDPDAIERALADLRAGEKLLGENQEATFWRGALLARLGRDADARAALAAAVAVRPQLSEFLVRLAEAGMLDEADVRRALSD